MVLSDFHKASCAETIFHNFGNVTGTWTLQLPMLSLITLNACCIKQVCDVSHTYLLVLGYLTARAPYTLLVVVVIALLTWHMTSRMSDITWGEHCSGPLLCPSVGDNSYTYL